MHTPIPIHRLSSTLYLPLLDLPFHLHISPVSAYFRTVHTFTLLPSNFHISIFTFNFNTVTVTFYRLLFTFTSTLTVYPLRVTFHCYIYFFRLYLSPVYRVPSYRYFCLHCYLLISTYLHFTFYLVRAYLHLFTFTFTFTLTSTVTVTFYRLPFTFTLACTVYPLRFYLPLLHLPFHFYRYLFTFDFLPVIKCDLLFVTRCCSTSL